MKISEKTQKMHFFQNSCTELAKIKNLHSTICLKVFPSSGRVALPPAFAHNERRGVQCRFYFYVLSLVLDKESFDLKVLMQYNI